MQTQVSAEIAAERRTDIGKSADWEDITPQPFWAGVGLGTLFWSTIFSIFWMSSTIYATLLEGALRMLERFG